MKKIIATVFIFLFLQAAIPITAQTTKPETIKARVGEFDFTLSGYSSPNASIYLKSNNILLGTTTAQPNGTFTFSNLPIDKGFSSFCLSTVDASQLGSSTGCMNIAPAEKDVVVSDVYLPPTIGLEKTSIDLGSSGLTYGYTMPDSDVSIQVSSGQVLETTSDQSGKYSYTVSGLEAGSYDLASSGLYLGQESLRPEESVQLRVLTSSASQTNEATGLRRFLRTYWPLLLIGTLLLLALILYLIHRFKPEWLAFVTKSRVYQALLRLMKRDLHHKWFIGY